MTTITLTEAEDAYLRSLLRIIRDPEAQVMQNAVVQRAEQDALELIESKLPEQN